MMRDIEKTIGNLVDRQGASFIASRSGDGFPHMKAMLPPRKRVGVREFYFTTNPSSMRVAQDRKHPNASISFMTNGSSEGLCWSVTWRYWRTPPAKK